MQLCYELHDGMYECDCSEGYELNKNGYSCDGKKPNQIIERKETYSACAEVTQCVVFYQLHITIIILT